MVSHIYVCSDEAKSSIPRLSLADIDHNVTELPITVLASPSVTTVTNGEKLY